MPVSPSGVGRDEVEGGCTGVFMSRLENLDVNLDVLAPRHPHA